MNKTKNTPDQVACLQEIVQMENVGYYTFEQILAHYQTLNRNQRTMNSDLTKYPRDPIYYVTASIVHSVDLLVKKVYKEVVIEGMKFCLKSDNFHVHAYCIMASKVHMLVSGVSKPFIASILSEFKLISTFELLKQIDKEKDERQNWMLWLFRLAAKARNSSNTYQIWEDEYDLIELLDLSQVNQKLEEIHRLPITDGFIEEAGDWIYSSAPNYQKRSGAMKVTMIPF